ncbi:MAG TPA: MmcQ/YjbR family DNA-binding protein [Pseudolabrys sp.]|nr:MmcQ/YjbR family DNA-binding protein [Pseudolabrys sp.]
MATAAEFRRIALSLAGTVEAPHFDRTAFKAARIYATLAADRKTANFRFTPDEQELKCMVAADAFAPIPNAWGRQGWTVGTLAKLSTAELGAALEMAWRHAQPRRGIRRRRQTIPKSRT